MVLKICSSLLCPSSVLASSCPSASREEMGFCLTGGVWMVGTQGMNQWTTCRKSLSTSREGKVGEGQRWQEVPLGALFPSPYHHIQSGPARTAAWFSVMLLCGWGEEEAEPSTGCCRGICYSLLGSCAPSLPGLLLSCQASWRPQPSVPHLRSPLQFCRLCRLCM